MTSTSNTGSSRSSNKRSQGRKKVSKDGAFNLHYAGGALFPLSFWLKNDHKEEAQYIEHFGTNVIDKWEADPEQDLSTTIVAVYTAKALYVPKPKVKDMKGNIVLDEDGVIAKPLAKAKQTALNKKVQEYLITDPYSAAKQEKYSEWDEEYGQILGWMNYLFVTGKQTKSGKIVKYNLHPAPRGTTLREKIGGHALAHNELLESHKQFHLLNGIFVYGDPSKNVHIKGSGNRKFNPEVLA